MAMVIAMVIAIAIANDTGIAVCRVAAICIADVARDMFR
jgi:hypothetical protein